MAAAAEEQHLATQEMAHNLERAAHRTSEIANMRIDTRSYATWKPAERLRLAQVRGNRSWSVGCKLTGLRRRSILRPR
jgi:hypothetical protein